MGGGFGGGGGGGEQRAGIWGGGGRLYCVNIHKECETTRVFLETLILNEHLNKHQNVIATF